MTTHPLCPNKLSLICERITNAICTEIELNAPSNLRWPCSICNKNVTSSMKGIQCDTCNKWCHIKCDCMTVGEYEYFITTNDDDSIGWNCLYCTMKLNHDNFAFTLVEDEEILKISFKT